ncbi:conserved hypothetical protein [Streptomyces pristinaespiralis ATCC 25486]|uniref:Uncharacterized protein n=1 Tax=Streptomyces pristinaespiralis (strain ATCC 25486 / DSM 40338 / CBS 914.69 / JCM 4507 / KCC S-0507 / NBRC 13074 / NRRL 2958 / 5647) TaxID=457429 RepID=D6X847_STRE2|nr:conserved hypothetical protein [Streptomyces pristinaespiralis ATCC 25486]
MRRPTADGVARGAAMVEVAVTAPRPGTGVLPAPGRRVFCD